MFLIPLAFLRPTTKDGEEWEILRTSLTAAIVSTIRWLVFSSTLIIVCACTFNTDVVNHAFSFDTGRDEQDGEVLDYRYGNSKLPVRRSETDLESGNPIAFNNINGPMLKGDFLYVKWRKKNSGQIYEKTVDLKKRLPSNIEGGRVHFMIYGEKLYIYLILDEPSLPGINKSGPSMYKSQKMLLIYPD